ncbi:dihydrolipoyl dehydrogenase [Natronolimnobius baerhuensis]|uniref:Dihydrolipoamide dehydrogenase n=1 Tax=Natronolimnobius baerhuensis TaxID=253108 RepID=A0A202E5N7_9EURY|nr:dihydrolipoyl dehydrogenase [Natronolimnobius baerhuensis]OVE83571.1 dihydrolipoamide dehydrogenase [Natronolimnobius baerhuensis]
MTTTAYDVVVIGGGSGSQVATAAAEQGLKAAVIEPGPLGGACITRGCIPSKALIHRADVAETVRRAGEFGIDADLESVDYGAFTDTIHDTVYEKAERQARSLEDNAHVTLYRGEGRFADDHTIRVEPGDDRDAVAVDGTERDDGVEGLEIESETIVLAVGGRPVVPPIDGLETVDFLTSDDALFLSAQPDSLVIVGGGYIGVELGYVFGALGTEVSLIGRSEHLVPREDDEISAVVTDSLERYCDVYTGYEASAVESGEGGGVVVTAEPTNKESDDGGDEPASVDLEADDLLLATGRQPNTDTLALENTGIETDESGHVETDTRLETAVEDVWALGDIVGEEPYKHAADYETRIVSANVLDAAETEVDYRAMPHAIFTSPQVASVGKTEGELEDDSREYESATVPFTAAPLGLIRGADDGIVKVLAGPDGEILGCHIAGPDASTLIQEVVVAMDSGSGTVDDVADPVHVHPALSEVVHAAFDELSARPYSTAPDWRDVA